MISGEDLAAYVAGDADPALVARVESAMSEDPTVGARLEAIRSIDDQLARWEAPTLGAAGAERLRASVDRDLDEVLGPVAASADAEADALAPIGGVQAAGARPAAVGLLDRARTWWRDQVGRRDLAGLASGLAVAAVVLVVVGVGVTGDLFGVGGDDSAAETTMMDAPTAAADAGTGGGEGFASGGTESATMSESMELEAAAEDDRAQIGADDAGATPVVDDGRVVADLDDVDPALLRDRLQPLVGLRENATEESAGQDAARPSSPTEGGQSDGSSSTSPGPLADALVDADDVGAVEACLPDVPGAPIVAEVVVLAPGRDVVLYLYDDRAVAVAVDDCSTLGVRLG